MSYQNNFNRGNGSWGGAATNYNPNFGNRTYNSPYGGSRGGYKKAYQKSNKKHSDCRKYENYVTKGGVKKAVLIRGWKYTRKHGLVSFVATPAKDKYQVNTKYVTFVAKVKSTFGEKLVWAKWNIAKEHLYFHDLKMVASPSKFYWSFITPKK